MSTIDIDSDHGMDEESDSDLDSFHNSSSPQQSVNHVEDDNPFFAVQRDPINEVMYQYRVEDNVHYDDQQPGLQDNQLPLYFEQSPMQLHADGMSFGDEALFAPLDSNLFDTSLGGVGRADDSMRTVDDDFAEVIARAMAQFDHNNLERQKSTILGGFLHDSEWNYSPFLTASRTSSPNMFKLCILQLSPSAFKNFFGKQYMHWASVYQAVNGRTWILETEQAHHVFGYNVSLKWDGWYVWTEISKFPQRFHDQFYDKFRSVTFNLAFPEVGHLGLSETDGLSYRECERIGALVAKLNTWSPEEGFQVFHGVTAEGEKDWFNNTTTNTAMTELLSKTVVVGEVTHTTSLYSMNVYTWKDTQPQHGNGASWVPLSPADWTIATYRTVLLYTHLTLKEYSIKAKRSHVTYPSTTWGNNRFMEPATDIKGLLDRIAQSDAEDNRPRKAGLQALGLKNINRAYPFRLSEWKVSSDSVGAGRCARSSIKKTPSKDHRDTSSLSSSILDLPAVVQPQPERAKEVEQAPSMDDRDSFQSHHRPTTEPTETQQEPQAEPGSLNAPPAGVESGKRWVRMMRRRWRHLLSRKVRAHVQTPQYSPHSPPKEPPTPRKHPDPGPATDSSAIPTQGDHTGDETHMGNPVAQKQPLVRFWNRLRRRSASRDESGPRGQREPTSGVVDVAGRRDKVASTFCSPHRERYGVPAPEPEELPPIASRPPSFFEIEEDPLE
ncbi:hypothetical protein BV22DRAFT_1131317 [Leucogyrophana mollusca]|uniref:Uncharacterized protein n=1 Tax=Leucogyrophana mollusca TaxID=85980 RepID=A0ACB8BA36_9AGAM|nr:hypothetical protein BV22DRAFT_1131317 [Leucogyrophana mollusca]